MTASHRLPALLPESCRCRHADGNECRLTSGLDPRLDVREYLRRRSRTSAARIWKHCPGQQPITATAAVLDAVAERPGITMRQISEWLGAEVSQTSAVLSKLTRQGRLERNRKAGLWRYSVPA